MSVRAKFYVSEKTEHNSNQPSFTIKLNPVTSGSKENEEFYKWTPGGSVVLSTVNAQAAEQFRPGKEFFLDFTPADALETPAP